MDGRSASYWERLDTEIATIKATDYGQKFVELGWDVYQAGGGFLIWMKPVPDTKVMLLAAAYNEGLDTAPDDDGWSVGLHSTEDANIDEDFPKSDLPQKTPEDIDTVGQVLVDRLRAVAGAINGK